MNFKNSKLLLIATIGVSANLYALNIDTMNMSPSSGGDCWFFGKTSEDPLCKDKTKATKTVAVQEQRQPSSMRSSLELDTGALFDIGSHDLKPAAKEKVINLADKIKTEKPNANEVAITGYADPTGTSGLNQELSELRARKVKDVLVEEGVKSSSIKTNGRGETNTVVGLDECQGKSGKALASCLAPNRRVEVNVL